MNTGTETRISFPEADKKSTKEEQTKAKVSPEKSGGSAGKKNSPIDAGKDITVKAKVESWVITFPRLASLLFITAGARPEVVHNFRGPFAALET